MKDGLKLYVDTSRQTDSFSRSRNRYTKYVLSVFEGDSIPLSIYFISDYNSQSVLIDNDEAIIISFATEDSLKSINNNYIALAQDFDLLTDSNGDVYYAGYLHLNTQEAIDVLGDKSRASATIEVCIVRKDLGYQTSYQNDATIQRSISPNTIRELVAPSEHIGTYASVRELCEEIAQKHILDLKDGAPLEFDTLFELAHYAQKVRSHEIQVGDFCDYLDGKKLADQNLTVVSLGNIMMNESTYVVSHEPWRPKDVTATIVE